MTPRVLALWDACVLSIVTCVVATGLVDRHQACAQQVDGARAKTTARKLMEKRFSGLNQRLNGRLTELIAGLDGVGAVNKYFRFYNGDDSPAARKDYEAFQAMFLQCVDGSDSPVGVEFAMLTDVWSKLAGPRIVLDTIGPHIGKGGQLGSLESLSTGVMSYVDGRPAGSRDCDFRAYLAYLGKNKRGTANRANGDLLIDHMMRTDPVAGLDIMLRLEYGMRDANGRIDWSQARDDAPGDVKNRYRDRAAEGTALYELNVMVRTVRGLGRVHSELPQGVLDRIRQLLAERATSETWWLREYVGAVMAAMPMLRDRGVMARLKSDKNEFVRANASRGTNRD